jgi:hypothetical protein
MKICTHCNGAIMPANQAFAYAGPICTCQYSNITPPPVNAEIRRLRAEVASLKEELRKDSEDMLRLIADIRYVASIAERGRGKPLGDGEMFTQAVLDYVKSLESQQRTLTQQLAAANGRVEMLRDALVAVKEQCIDGHMFTAQMRPPSHWLNMVPAALSNLNEDSGNKP